MKKWGLISAVLVLVFLAVSSSHFQAQQGKENVSILTANSGIKQSKVKIEKDYGKMPLCFIPNQGQMDKKVYYYVQGKDKTVYFTSEGITYSLVSLPETPEPGPSDRSKLEFPGDQRLRDPAKPSQRWVVKLEFVGARKNVKPESLEQSGTVISYFKGQKKDWKAGLQAASKILYRDLWPGIDLVYYGTVNRMKYEFIVHPGADPAQIELAYRGAKSVKENSQGQLEVQTPMGGFFDDTPVAWQEIAGKRENVALKYAIEKGKSGKETREAPVLTYGFTIGKYDPQQTLVLDPAVLVYCGYIGGAPMEYGSGIAVDASGCAYVIGATTAIETTFPVTAGPDLTSNGSLDAFVAKVNADGMGLIYCGYIGGSGEDHGNGIAVDASGCAYLSGHTASTEATFPVIGGLGLTHNGGYNDAFVAKVKADGTGLDYCGYIGGSSDDRANKIVVDGLGCAYVIGHTCSTEITFPVIGGPDLTHNGGWDAFVAKISTDGASLVYCGYIGGSYGDGGNGIAVDASGCTYVTGDTASDETTFPVTVGPYLTFLAGDYDAYVAKVNTAGTGLVYCGYIGGSGSDSSWQIAVDASDCAYVSGYTESDQATFPVIGGPDLTFNGGQDAFVAKVKADGTGLDFCGYIGGSNIDRLYGIAVDTLGCSYVNGYTNSTETTFPVIGGPDLTFNGGGNDGFVAKVKADGTGLQYCGYIGGSWNDDGCGIAVDATGCAYVTGSTESDETTFPVTVGPDMTYNGGWNSFVAKISWANPTVNFAAGNGGSLTGITTQSVEYGGNCTPVEAVPNDGYNFVNWTGTGGFITTTDNPLTVTNVNSDMMITAHFAHANPAGWVPLEDSQNNMIVYGKAYNGNNPAAVGDWLGAFGPGGISDCRGIAAVQTNGNYYITIGSNETSGETITFKLWPLPSGPSIDSSESITFIENGVYAGLPLHFGPRGQNFALVNGWNWISFNTLPTDTSFNAVFGSLAGHIEQVKSQSQAAIYTGGTWIGDLTNMSGIANGIMYKVKTNQAGAFNVTGMTVSYNTPLSLITGWNWTAYLPTLTQPVQDAVNSIITPVSQVKSQTQSVIKIGSTLFGDLTQMEPNKGYLILMNQAGVLVYPQGESVFPDLSAEKTAAAKTTAVSWPLIKGNQYNMVALGKVYYEGKPVETDGFYLGSIGPNGSNDGRSLSPVKTDGTYFATVLGNTAGETVKFKLINSTKGKTYDVAGTLEFQPDGLKTGYDLKARSVKVTAPAAGTALRMGTTAAISWAAYEVNNLKIELYKGSKVLSTLAASLPANTGTYNWKIPSGMVAGNDYQVKVSCIEPGVSAEGWSSAFSIKPAATIDLLSPNGGEVWQVKRSYDIKWRSTGIDNIRIELYKGTELKTVISASTPAGTGKYAWAIPANQTQGANYKIKISAVEVGISKTGDRYFSITATGTRSAH